MTDPYRDELLALRAENARLRKVLARRGGGRANAAVLIGATVLSYVAFQAVLPLLNATRDASFWLGVVCVALIVAADLACIVMVVARRDPRQARDP